MGHKDLRFGNIFNILVFYNISLSCLLPLEGFQYFFVPFLLRDGKNEEYSTKSGSLPLCDWTSTCYVCGDSVTDLASKSPQSRMSCLLREVTPSAATAG